MVILLEQVATENILKIAVLKKLMPCSVPTFLQNISKSIRFWQMLFSISID